MKIKFLGEVFGSADGWDQVADNIVHYYNVVSEREDINGFDISFDSENGLIGIYNSETGDEIKYVKFDEFMSLTRV